MSNDSNEPTNKGLSIRVTRYWVLVVDKGINHEISVSLYSRINYVHWIKALLFVKQNSKEHARLTWKQGCNRKIVNYIDIISYCAFQVSYNMYGCIHVRCPWITHKLTELSHHI